MTECGIISRLLKALTRRAGVVCLLFGFLYAQDSARPQVAISALGASNTGPLQHKECVEAARGVLGECIEVLRCGNLNNTTVLETVAAIRKGPSHNGTNGVFVSQLVILRQEPSGWEKALTASRQISNSEGYIGIDYIDDSTSYWGYSVQFHDHRADGKAAFVLSLRYMSSERDTDEFPVDITWNEHAGRYQEFSMNYDPLGFKPELKNPSHR